MVTKAQILEAIELLKTHKLGSLEIEYGANSRLKITQQPQGGTHIIPTGTQPFATMAEAAPPETHKQTLNSPLIGTVYLAPSPEAKPFVQVGDKVKVGQTLCIVEAMKTFNEVPATQEGIIDQILINNAESVEYNQPLFQLREPA